MKSEDLLKPRFKLIADYPGNTNEIGHVTVEISTATYFRKYAANFKELEWWEEREIEDMPEYIRLNQKWVAKVHKHHEIRHDQFEADNGNYYPYDITLPSTKDEYENKN